jgi:hypothetical protein
MRSRSAAYGPIARLAAVAVDEVVQLERIAVEVVELVLRACASGGVDVGRVLQALLAHAAHVVGRRDGVGQECPRRVVVEREAHCVADRRLGRRVVEHRAEVHAGALHGLALGRGGVREDRCEVGAVEVLRRLRPGQRNERRHDVGQAGEVAVSCARGNSTGLETTSGTWMVSS